MVASDSRSREARYKLRLQSDRFFEGCVENGYIVRRDQPVYEDSNAELIRFLNDKLRNSH